MATGSVRMARLLRSVLSDGLLCAHSRRLTKLSTSSPPGDVLVTYACSSCVFSVSPLRFDAQPTADGGLTKLRVWATSRHTCVLRAA